MKRKLKHILNLLGVTVSLVAVLFVGLRLYEYGSTFGLSRVEDVGFLSGIGIAVLYTLSNILLVVAWWYILKHLSLTVTYSWAFQNYGMSQVAKYIPGNVFQLAGRQSLGMASGLPGVALAKSSIYELGLIATSGVSISILTLPLFVSFVSVETAIVLFVSIVIVLLFTMDKLFGRFFVVSYLFYSVFLFFTGTLFVLVISIFNELQLSFFDYILLVSSYVAAWFFGLVTPGSPAGLGVREMVLLYMLDGVLNETVIVPIVLTCRIATVISDILFFALAVFSHVVFCKKREFVGR